MTPRTACARLLRALAARIDPPTPPRTPDDEYAARLRAHIDNRPTVVPDNPPSAASGRADLQLTHTPGHLTVYECTDRCWHTRRPEQGHAPDCPRIPAAPHTRARIARLLPEQP